MGTFNYLKTCVEPTSISDALACRLLGSSSMNIVIAKHNILEVYTIPVPRRPFTLGDNGIGVGSFTLRKKYYLKEKISALGCVKRRGFNLENLLVLTYSCDVLLLGYERKSDDVVTVASVYAGSNMYPHSDVDHLCCVNFEQTYAAMRLNCELLKLVRLEPSKDSQRLDVYTFHIDDSHIMSMCFLPDVFDSNRLILGLLTERGQERHFCVYELFVNTVQAVRLFGTERGMDLKTDVLVPMSALDGGALLIGDGALTYYHQLSTHTFVPQTIIDSTFTAACVINPTCEVPVVVALTSSGHIFQLTRNLTNPLVPFIPTLLGRAPCADQIFHIGNGLLFAFSYVGNSIMLQLCETDKGVDCVVLDMCSGYGPVVDMALIHDRSLPSNNLLVCSGTDSDGTLRLMVNGTVIQEHHFFDVDLAKNMWLLLDHHSNNYFILITLQSGGTIMFEIDNNLHGKSVELPSPIDSEVTLYATTVKKGENVVVVIVTTSVVRVLQLTTPSLSFSPSAQTFQVVDQWTPPVSNEEIVAAACSTSGLVVVATDSGMISLCVEDNLSLKMIERYRAAKVACITLSEPSSPNETPKFILYYGWAQRELRIVHVSTGENCMMVTIPKSRVVRSILALEKPHLNEMLLFYSFIDSTVACANIDLANKRLIHKHKFRTPRSWGGNLNLLRLSSPDRLVIVHCCQESTFLEVNMELMRSKQPRLNMSILRSFTHSNIQHIKSMVVPRALGHKNQVIYLGSCHVGFGHLLLNDNTLCHRTFRLYESPKFICYQLETRTIALITALVRQPNKESENSAKHFYDSLLQQNGMIDACGVETPIPISQRLPTSSSVREIVNPDPNWQWTESSCKYSLTILDFDSFTPIRTLHFHNCETVACLTTLRLGLVDSPPFYVTASNLVSNPDTEECKGFLRLFHARDHKLRLVDEVTFDNMLFSVAQMHGKLLVGAAGNVHVLELNTDDRLVAKCKVDCGMMPILLKPLGNEVLVGDVLNNTTVMEMVDVESGLLVVTLHNNMPSWITSAHIVSPGIFISTNVHKYANVFTKRPPPNRRLSKHYGAAYSQKAAAEMEDDEDSTEDQLENNGYKSHISGDETSPKVITDNPYRYEVLGKFHVADHINAICHGSLNPSYKGICCSGFECEEQLLYAPPNSVMGTCVHNPTAYERSSLSFVQPDHCILMSGASGAIKTMFDITPEQYYALNTVYKRLVRFHRSKCPGGSFNDPNNSLIYSKIMKRVHKGFIDGDILKHVLHLPEYFLMEILSNVSIPFNYDTPSDAESFTGDISISPNLGSGSGVISECDEHDDSHIPFSESQSSDGDIATSNRFSESSTSYDPIALLNLIKNLDAY